MNGRWANVAILVGAVWAFGASGALANPPWSLVPFQKIDADPKKSYAVTEDHGPWMILAASFSGEGSEQQAQELVVELRKRYKLEAYTYKRHVNDTEPQIGLGLDKYGKPKRMKPVNPFNHDEVAVLVGNYGSVEDSRAQKALKTLKYARPDTLDVTKRPTTQSLAIMRYMQSGVHKMVNSKQAEMGPMRSAMLTRNPLLPEEFFQQGGLDQFVLSMNANLVHSLLKCPGQYSVKVATFRGKDTMLLKEIDAMSKTNEVSEKLELGAIKANKLTTALRRMGYEAYEFHDRHESVVTIGSFDSLGEPRPDGKTEIDPAMHKIIETFKAQPQMLNGLPTPAMKPQLLEGIAFDVQPVPIAVPRRSFGSDYVRGQ